MDLITLLNDFAGLFALLALIATIVVPIVLYKKQKQDERQAMQDELDAMNNLDRFPFTDSQRQHHLRKYILEKGLKRK